MWMRRQTPTAVSSTTITTLDSLQRERPACASPTSPRARRFRQPGMTSLVNRLEAAGQAERVADPTDGRATLRAHHRGRPRALLNAARRARAVLARAARASSTPTTATRCCGRARHRRAHRDRLDAARPSRPH